jgi:hypothetical protein
MAKTKPEEWKLKSITPKPKGKFEVKYHDGTMNRMAEPTLPLHPDFQKVLDKSLAHLAEYYGLPKEAAVDQISMKNVIITNYEDKEGQSVQITGVYSHPKSGQNTTIKTSKVQTHEDQYGFEDVLKKTVIKLAEEAYQYVVNLRSSQLKMEVEEAA